MTDQGVLSQDGKDSSENSHKSSTGSHVKKSRAVKFLGRRGTEASMQGETPKANEDGDSSVPPARWSFGVLNDKLTDEVPGMKVAVCTLPGGMLLGSPDNVRKVEQARLI